MMNLFAEKVLTQMTLLMRAKILLADSCSGEKRL